MYLVAACDPGLGKIPGIYYRPSGYTGRYLMQQLMEAIDVAMAAPPAVLQASDNVSLIATVRLR
jgi:hypothetical protein